MIFGSLCLGNLNNSKLAEKKKNRNCSTIGTVVSYFAIKLNFMKQISGRGGVNRFIKDVLNKHVF